MKNLNLIQLPLFCLILFSCHSKPEIKEQPVKQQRVDYVIQNYKLDDDEITRRQKDSAAKKTIAKEEKKDSLLTEK
ncbi:MAG: hypothetical protein KA208_04870 [Flavobacterium sp.]|nr:hypothetical protein [Flavobacterium sp.]MBP6587338.1 hypothetical protein [Flavobacterium sp.]